MTKNPMKQESIPVGCALPARSPGSGAIWGGGAVHGDLCCPGGAVQGDGCCPGGGCCTAGWVLSITGSGNITPPLNRMTDKQE